MFFALGLQLPLPSVTRGGRAVHQASLPLWLRQQQAQGQRLQTRQRQDPTQWQEQVRLQFSIKKIIMLEL